MNEKSWVENGLQAVCEARRNAFEKGRRTGARWLIECRDLWDFANLAEDAGIFFVFAATEAEVDAAIARYAPDKYNGIDAIFDLDLSPDEYLDITPQDWQAGIRTPRRRSPDG